MAIGINKKKSIAFLIDNLKIIEIFKNKDRKKGVSVIDFIILILQLLKTKLKELVNMV